MAEDLTATEVPSHRPVVLVLRPLGASFLEALDRRFHLLKPWEEEDGVDAESGTASDAFLSRHAESIRAIVCESTGRVDANVLAFLPRLGCVVATSMGVDHVDLDGCRRRGIAVANGGAVFVSDTADYAVGLLIDVLRGVSAGDRYVRSGRWSHQGDFPLGTRLGGKRVGILGLGRIGSEIAKRLEAFGCAISYHSRTEKATVSYTYCSDVRDLAKRSDALIVACALTERTRHIVNGDVLSALGKEGVVVNVGRGGLIDERALVVHLLRGDVGGAGLDVFEKEPHVPPELLLMDNVVLSPHRAFLSPEAVSDLIQLTVDNLDAFFSGRPLASAVSWCDRIKGNSWVRS